MGRKTLWYALWHTERWQDRVNLLRSTFWHMPIMRLDNRWQDMRAVLAGACNRSMWDGHGYSGGYSHWRCARERGHRGGHRFHNYVWHGPGTRVIFDPLPIRNADNSDWFDISDALPFFKLTRGRRAIDRRSRARQLARIYESERMARHA